MDEKFEIPKNYKIERALQAPLPRAVPDTLRRHPARLAQQASNRRAIWITLGLAVASFFLRDTSFFQILGLYFTPFAYLEWVSPVVAVICVLALLEWHPWKKDPYRYLREGLPLVGQVVDLRLEVAARVNGQDSQWAYDVYFQALHPTSGELNIFCVRSPEFAGGHPLLKCRVGDWVTAVYLPGNLDSITLYGFTDADPDASLLESTKGGSVGMALLGVLGTIFGCAWIFSSYSLASVDKSLLMATCVPGVIIGSVAGVIWLRGVRQKHAKQQEAALAAGLPLAGATHRNGNIFGGIFLGSFMGCLGFALVLVGLNGALDSSEAEVKPVRVVNTWVTTHNGIFKTYDVEYVDPYTGKTEKMGVSPLDLEQDGDLAAELLTYKGALGWPRQNMRVRVLSEDEIQKTDGPANL